MLAYCDMKTEGRLWTSQSSFSFYKIERVECSECSNGASARVSKRSSSTK